MQNKITKFLNFFCTILHNRFYQNNQEAIEILLMLVTGHLFGLYNPNQLADYLGIEKSKLYRKLKEWSLYQWKRILLEVGCQKALEEIQKTMEMSASTKSRRRITISVDDTVVKRFGEVLSYTYNWWSTTWNKSINSQNILAITLKIDDQVIPLYTRPVRREISPLNI